MVLVFYVPVVEPEPSVLDHKGFVAQGVNMTSVDAYVFREGHIWVYVAAAILCQQHLPVGIIHSILDAPVIAVDPGPTSSVAALTRVPETMDKQVVMAGE